MDTDNFKEDFLSNYRFDVEITPKAAISVVYSHYYKKQYNIYNEDPLHILCDFLAYRKNGQAHGLAHSAPCRHVRI